MERWNQLHHDQGITHRWIKKLFLASLALFIVFLLLFPKQIVLKYVAWKAKSYCLEAFAAHLLIDSITWNEGTIVIKGGKLYRKDQIDASFDVASLVPHINWKKRMISGTLKVDGLKIIHKKKVSLPILTPSPPCFQFFTLQFDTYLEGGELFSLRLHRKNHFFRHARFDLTHHVCDDQASGTLVCEWEHNTAPMVTHFKTTGDTRSLDGYSIDSCPLPILSYLATYFFHNYLPESAIEWEILNGRAQGECEMVFIKGVPGTMKGKFHLEEALAQISKSTPNLFFLVKS